MAPLVSVAITTRNRRALLPEAIASVEAQTLPDRELIVVDDASEDDTWSWLAAQPGLRAVRLASNSGRSKARNRGLAEAAGECVMFLDDDDRLRPDALARLSSALQAEPAAVAAVGALWRFGDGIAPSRMNHPVRASTRIVWPELLAGWSAVSGQNLYRAAIVRQVGGYRSEWECVEDRDLWLRVARRGPVCLVPDAVVEYRVHPGQWRPPDIVERRERLFANFIASLPAGEQRRARRIRAGGRAWGRAELAREAGRFSEAARACVTAIASCPALLRSPILWPPLLRGLLESLRGLAGL